MINIGRTMKVMTYSMTCKTRYNIVTIFSSCFTNDLTDWTKIFTIATNWYSIIKALLCSFHQMNTFFIYISHCIGFWTVTMMTININLKKKKTFLQEIHKKLKNGKWKRLLYSHINIYYISIAKRSIVRYAMTYYIINWSANWFWKSSVV